MTAQAGAVAACPLCGCAPEGPRQLTDIVWSMDCSNVLHHVNAMSWTSAEDCIDNWNRRYLPTPPAAVPVEALEGLVAKWAEDASRMLDDAENMRDDDPRAARLLISMAEQQVRDADELTQLIKERSNG